MNLPRPRFTVRRSMVAVAILAVLLWAMQTGWRWQDYRRQAAHHAQVMADRIAGVEAGGRSVAANRKELEFMRKNRRAFESYDFRGRPERAQEIFKSLDDAISRQVDYVAGMDEAIGNTRAQAAFHARLYWKYQTASAHPWLRVAADPPMPQTVAELAKYLTPENEALVGRLKPMLPPPSQQPLEAMETATTPAGE